MHLHKVCGHLTIFKHENDIPQQRQPHHVIQLYSRPLCSFLLSLGLLLLGRGLPMIQLHVGFTVEQVGIRELFEDSCREQTKGVTLQKVRS